MKKSEKADLKNNFYTKKTDDYTSKHINRKVFYIQDIINELAKENPGLNAVKAFEIITAFNQKVLDLVSNGNQINTGLVNLYPVIKGQLNNKIWNPDINRLEVMIRRGIDLRKTLFDKNNQIQAKNEIELDVNNQFKKQSELKISIQKKSINNNTDSNLNSEPPCGIAFRKWLLNS